MFADRPHARARLRYARYYAARSAKPHCPTTDLRESRNLYARGFARLYRLYVGSRIELHARALLNRNKCDIAARR